MGDSTSRTSRRRSRNASKLTQALFAASEHRHLVLAVGVTLVVCAVWGGMRQSSGTARPQQDDGLAEMDGFDSPPAPTWGAANKLEPFTQPTTPNEPPLDLGAVFASAATTVHPAPVNAAHLVLPMDPSVESAPVWLTGAIETVEDAAGHPAANATESAIRYVRPAHR